MNVALGDRRGGQREIGAFLIGKTHTYSDYYEVSREKIREYANAVQDFHPAHWTEEGAENLGYPALLTSPTFLSTFAWNVMMEFLDANDVGLELGKMVQTEQTYTYHRPVTARMRLDAEFRVDDYRQLGGTETMRLHTSFIDHENKQLIQEVDVTLVKYSSRDGINLRSQAE